MEQCLRVSLEALDVDTDQPYRKILSSLINKRTMTNNGNVESDKSSDLVNTRIMASNNDMVRIKCRYCGSLETVVRHVTHRSADEGEKTILFCKKCRREQ